jgi:hypothetical protein
MISCFSKVVKAAEILTSNLGAPKDRLLRATTDLWSAMAFPEQWPADLWERAYAICTILLKDGPFKMSIEQMDAETTSQVLARIAPQLSELAGDIEKAHKEGRIAGDREKGCPRWRDARPFSPQQSPVTPSQSSLTIPVKMNLFTLTSLSAEHGRSV